MGTSQIQKPNYLESDTRSLSIDGATDHGKFGYTTNNNNQFAQSSLGHRNNNEPTTQNTDTINKNLIVDDKQSEYEQDANTETETKSVSSQKSDGSNPEARYLHIFCFCFFFYNFFYDKLSFTFAKLTLINQKTLCLRV